MDINAFNAAKTYGAAQQTLRPDVKKPSFGEGANGAFNPGEIAKSLVSTVAASENTAAAYMTGQADPHSVVEALASAELAVETAVTLRNRVVEAYQELMRMPV